MKYYVGLDVSLATTAICTVDENGARPMLVGALPFGSNALYFIK